MKHLILLAKGPSRVDCDYQADEVWGLNDCYAQDGVKKLDKVFFVKDFLDPKYLYNVDWLVEAYEKYNFELVSSVPITHPKLKATLFPLRDISDHFNTNFFCNTMCYMLAHALYLSTMKRADGTYEKTEDGFDRISMYGFDMRGEHEYIRELPCMDFWCGIARGIGIRLDNTSFSAMMKSPEASIYGDWPESTVKKLNGKVYDGGFES